MGEHDINSHQIVKCVRLYFNTLDYQTFYFRWGTEAMWVLEGDLEV